MLVCQIDNGHAARKTKAVTMSLLKASSLLVIFFVLLMFFFPGAYGPYSVSHGPATAMRASRAAKWIFKTISLCGRALFVSCHNTIGEVASPVVSLLTFTSGQSLAPVLSLRC